MRIFYFMAICLLLSSCSDKTKNQDVNVQDKQVIEKLDNNETQNSVTQSNGQVSSVIQTAENQVADDTPSVNLDIQNTQVYNVDGINPSDIVWGNRDAKVLLIEYSSPTCPYCANYRDKTFRQIKEKYIDTNKIAYVLRLFISSQQDLYASTLALCDKTKFQAFVDILYSRQQSWAFSHNYQEILTNIGQLGGISPNEYKKCLDDSRISDMLLFQTKRLDKKFEPTPVGIPAFLINGHLLLKSHSFDEISKNIEKFLAE